MEPKNVLKALAAALLAASATLHGCSTEPPAGDPDASGGAVDGSATGADAASAATDASTSTADADSLAADAAPSQADGALALPDAAVAAGDASVTPGADAAVVAAPDAGLPDAAAAVDGGASADAGGSDPSALPQVETATWEGTLANGKQVLVTYPKAWSGPMPLVVFAHGFQLGRGDYQDTADHLARYGYVVASADYPGSVLGIDHHDLVEALRDAITLLTTSPPAALAGRVDATRVAAMGHSLGGKGAVWTAIEEAKVKAVVSLDPVDDDQSPTGQDPVKHPSITPEKMGGLTVPVLYFAGEKSGSCAPAASNACRFDEASTASGAHYLAVLKNFGHMQFVESSFCLLCSTCASGVSGAALDLSRASMRGMIVAFLEETLRQNPAWHGWLSGAERDSLATRGVLLGSAAQATFCTPP